LTKHKNTPIPGHHDIPSPTGGVQEAAPRHGEPSGRQWTCISIACASDDADDLAALVAEHFAVGVEIIEDAIRFYLPLQVGVVESWEGELRQVLDEYRAIHGESEGFQVTSHLVVDEGWADRWKEHFKPLRVGRRFIVCPTWEEPRAGTGDLVIRIDPGQAFGTGHHETTRLCLEWLDDYDSHLVSEDRTTTGSRGRLSLLDVGTGTGILAMGAVLLGWSAVTAVDNDPEAVRVAAENLQINGMTSRVRLATGSVGQVSGRFEVVMANIQALPLIDLAQALVEKLSSSGRLALSGVLVEQRDLVVAAYRGQNLRLSSERTAGEWCLLEFAADHGALETK
jgi:ribosomal protein L11 methyltransferase